MNHNELVSYALNFLKDNFDVEDEFMRDDVCGMMDGTWAMAEDATVIKELNINIDDALSNITGALANHEFGVKRCDLVNMILTMCTFGDKMIKEVGDRGHDIVLNYLDVLHGAHHSVQFDRMSDFEDACKLFLKG